MQSTKKCIHAAVNVVALCEKNFNDELSNLPSIAAIIFFIASRCT